MPAAHGARRRRRRRGAADPPQPGRGRPRRPVRQRRAAAARHAGWPSSRCSGPGRVAFVALGLLIGLALDEKAAGGAIGIVGVVLAALGGLWVPVEVFPSGDAGRGARHAVVLVRAAGPRRRGGRAHRPRSRCSSSPAFTAGFAALAVVGGPVAADVRGLRMSPALRSAPWRAEAAWQRAELGAARGCCSWPSRSPTWSAPRGRWPCGWSRPSGLAVFTVAYLVAVRPDAGDRRPAAARPSCALVARPRRRRWRSGSAPSWAGLLIYVSAAVAATLPQRWVWPAVLAAAGVCTAVVAADGLLGDAVHPAAVRAC